MKKILGVAGIFFLQVIVCIGNSHAADKNIRKYYELYSSTSTPENYKLELKRSIDRKERAQKMRAQVRRVAMQRVSSAMPVPKVASISAVVPAETATEFKLGEIYCYPNPAKKTNPTFHIETGLAEKVNLKIYDVSGDIVHETTLSGALQLIDDGQGPQYAYEYTWNVNGVGSGVYVFSMTSWQGDKALKKTGRCAVIK